MAYPSTRLSELLRAVEGGHRLDTVEALAILPEVPASEVAAAIKRIEHEVRERYPKVRRIFLEPVAAQAPKP